ncbi:MAG: hypothetical protein ABIH52_02255 [Candidatus Aenigmatarchaeota archaeon]|nr:hypothetical protein [Nanoarchaeota archaeon]
MKLIILIFVLATIFVSGCVTETTPEIDQMCRSECFNAKEAGTDLSAGPCLSSHEDWVCDVAHDPRQDVDNLPENQCPEYGKTASHFVEVDPECKLIRIV